MSKELEKVKQEIARQTFDLEQADYIEFLRELANWAENEAGLLEFESPDVPDYADE